MAQDTPENGVPLIEGQLTFTVEEEVDDEASRQSSALVAPHPDRDEAPPQLSAAWAKNFKGFSDFTATLGRFNVLAGPNNSGKSTLLEAIHLLFSLLKLHQEGDRLATTGRLVPMGIMPVAAYRDLFYKRVSREGNRYVYATVGARFSDGSHVEFGVRALFGSLNSKVLSEQGMAGNRLAALLARPAVWVPSSVGIVRDEEYRTPARQAGLVNAGRHNEVLRNLLLDLTDDKQRFQLLQDTLAERFGAQLGDVMFDRSLDQFVTADYQGAAGVQHDLFSAGSGFIQTVQLLAFILSQNASVVLLDEPDAHLHSSLQRTVVEILEDIARKRGFQVLIATHSKEIINFVDPTRLLLVEPGATQASLASTEVTPIAILKSLGAIDNVDAYSLVKNRKCLFLEGRSDATVLGRFAAALHNRSFTGDDRVVIVPVGGAGRFEHVAQLNVFEKLLNAAVQTLEVRDRDGRTDEHRAALMEKAPRDLHVLELDSIESYLLSPTIIARVVAEVSAERGQQAEPAADDITSLLLDLTEEMRDATIDRAAQRYVDDVYDFTKARPTVPVANAAARALVDANWEGLERRLRVVKGKELLAALRAAVQDRYGVSFGNERLAEAFASDDLEDEIKNVLDRVAAL